MSDEIWLEVQRLQNQREREAREAEERQKAWDRRIQVYFDTAKTDEGINKIERLFGYQDYDPVECCKYLPGMIAELRRLREVEKAAQGKQ